MVQELDTPALGLGGSDGRPGEAAPHLLIDFATEENLDQFSPSGFSYREKLGRWSLGAVSRIELPVDGHAGPFELSVSLWTKPPAGLVKRMLIVKVDGTAIHAQPVSGMCLVRARIPAELRRAGQQHMQVEFFHVPPPALGPAGQDGDPRPLALLFQRLTLVKLPGVPDTKPVPTPDQRDFATVPAELGAAPHDQTLQIFAAASAGGPAELVGTTLDDSRFAAEHTHYRAPGPTFARAIRGASVWGNGLLRNHQGDVLLPEGCFPRYFAGHAGSGHRTLPDVWSGAIGKPDARPLRVDTPVVSVMHPNVVYGHFLLEMLPRLYQYSVLRDWGCSGRLILSERLPAWVKQFFSLYEPADRIAWYDHSRDFVEAPCVIVPSMMHDDHHFHPAINQMVSDLLLRVRGPVDERDLTDFRRIYVSRTAMPGTNRVVNEAEVEATMREMGFAILHPQTIPIQEQIRIYAQADVIAGEFSSALHNSLFMRPGSGVIAINFFNSYQSAICRVRRQKIAYVPPSGGVFRHWKLTPDLPRSFEVDCHQLRATTAMMLAAVS